MEYIIEINDSVRISKVILTGILTVSEMGPIGKEARLKAYELGYKLLFDFRSVDVNVTMAEAFNYPREAYSDIEPATKIIPTAHLVKIEDEEFWSFVEISFRNVGMNIRMFFDENEAVEWLSNY